MKIRISDLYPENNNELEISFDKDGDLVLINVNSGDLITVSLQEIEDSIKFLLNNQ